MTEFLRQVAGHFYEEGKISSLCFVFPNRRSMVFFLNYLREIVRAAGKPLIAPAMYTMNDFFYKVAGARKTEKVALLLELYECYKKYNPQERLDDFIFWGEVLLSDFDDVDKYYVPKPSSLFANVTDFKDIQDDYSYLTENQRKAVEEFMSHFGKGGGGMKDAFRRVWDVLFPLYSDFNSRLLSKDMCYEGMVYREVASRLEKESVSDILAAEFPGVGGYVFVGLNALNECERILLRRMRNAGVARFCWDYQSGWIKSPANKSSFFMKGNLEEFRQEFDLEPLGPDGPHINVVGVASSVGQAKLIQNILPDGADIDTAVVLPDESLLLPVLNSIPESIRGINVTMGYPLSGSQLYSLMSEAARMQTRLYVKEGEVFFYHKQVYSIFSNSLFKTVAGEEGQARIEAVRKSARFYISQSDLSGIPVFDLVFRPCTDLSSLKEYLGSLVYGIAVRIKEDPDMSLELDFAKDYHECLTALAKYDLPVNLQTYVRLLDRMMSSRTVPFQGEPLKGLQIMGPLEMRALDFKNLVILSCNEGIFPRHSVSPSFIPAELRKAFGLPTYEFQDAMWAYYFYRVVQRAENVWLLYDSRMKNMKAGEESRYIKQLELHFGADVKRLAATSPLRNVGAQEYIIKTQADVDVIKGKPVSPSSLKTYLSCQARFYYQVVKGLKEEEDLSESLDARTVGNVFHKTMQELYTVPGGTVTRARLERISADRDGLRSMISAKIMEELGTKEVKGRDLVYRRMVEEYVLKTIQRDLELLRSEHSDGIKVIGLEKRAEVRIGDYRLYGIIDRLDSLSEGEVRVVDYKTGMVKDNDTGITDGNAAGVVADMFGNNDANRPTIALQLLIYDMFVKKDYPGKRIVNAIYSPSRMFVEAVANEPLSEVFYELMYEGVKRLLDEISDTSVNFSRTKSVRSCENCSFRILCGR